MDTTAFAIKFTPRVAKSKIRRIYEDDAKGIRDDELIEDVAFTLYMRCLDIMAVTDARNGAVRCQYCWSKKGEAAYVKYDKNTPHNEMQKLVLTCECGFTFAWTDYVKAYRNSQLNMGGALPAFSTYMEKYPKAQSAKEKMLLIDYLIHEFHYSLKTQPELPTRSVGANLIEGKLTDIMAFLDALTYETVNPNLARTAAEWQDKAERFRDKFGS